MRNRKTNRIANILESSPSGILEKIEISQELDAAWIQVVGEQWAQRAYPVRVERSTLIVGVYEPIWIQEFEMMSSEILQRLRTQMPQISVRGLRFEYTRPNDKPKPAQRQSWRASREQS